MFDLLWILGRTTYDLHCYIFIFAVQHIFLSAQTFNYTSFLIWSLQIVQRTATMEKTLKDNCGWKQVIKRGAHTLKKRQYQVVYSQFKLLFGSSWMLNNFCSLIQMLNNFVSALLCWFRNSERSRTGKTEDNR